MAIWTRRGGLDGLVHHSDRGGQYFAICYPERLAEFEATYPRRDDPSRTAGLKDPSSGEPRAVQALT
jgi:hypothetical protein